VADSIIRPGNAVRLLDPRRILRIDYEVTAKSLIPEVEVDPAVLEFCQSQRLNYRSQERVILAVATSRMHNQMKTGAEKKIVFDEIIEYMRGNTYQVEGKKVRYSGTFYHGHSGTDYWGEYSYEPAGLDNRTAHVCLKLACNWLGGISDGCDEWEGFWVTTDQVEKVEKEEDKSNAY
jgi:hypothetical protein